MRRNSTKNRFFDTNFPMRTLLDGLLDAPKRITILDRPTTSSHKNNHCAGQYNSFINACMGFWSRILYPEIFQVFFVALSWACEEAEESYIVGVFIFTKSCSEFFLRNLESHDRERKRGEGSKFHRLFY